MSPKELHSYGKKKLNATLHGKTEGTLRKIKETLKDELLEIEEKKKEIQSFLDSVVRELNLREIENDLE